MADEWETTLAQEAPAQEPPMQEVGSYPPEQEPEPVAITADSLMEELYQGASDWLSGFSESPEGGFANTLLDAVHQDYAPDQPAGQPQEFNAGGQASGIGDWFKGMWSSLSAPAQAAMVNGGINLLAGAASGYAKGKQAEAANKLEQERLDLAKSKQDTARTSASGVTISRGGLISRRVTQ